MTPLLSLLSVLIASVTVLALIAASVPSIPRATRRVPGPLAVIGVVLVAAGLLRSAALVVITVGSAVVVALVVGAVARAERRDAAFLPRITRTAAGPAGRCESCQRSPATVRVSFPDGAVFQVCTPCAPTAAGTTAGSMRRDGVPMVGGRR